MKSACFLGFRLIFLLPPIQPHLAGGRRHPSSHPSPAAQHQAEPTHGAPRPAVDFHEPPPSAAPRPAVGRREPSPSAAVSPHRQPPRATAICRREPPPSAAPGARLAPLLRSSTSRCPRPLRSPGAPPVRCSPGALPLPDYHSTPLLHHASCHRRGRWLLPSAPSRPRLGVPPSAFVPSPARGDQIALLLLVPALYFCKQASWFSRIP